MNATKTECAACGWQSTTVNPDEQVCPHCGTDLNPATNDNQSFVDELRRRLFAGPDTTREQRRATFLWATAELRQRFVETSFRVYGNQRDGRIEDDVTSDFVCNVLCAHDDGPEAHYTPLFDFVVDDILLNFTQEHASVSLDPFGKLCVVTDVGQSYQSTIIVQPQKGRG